MKRFCRTLCVALLGGFLGSPVCVLGADQPIPDPALAWPEVTRTARPWAYWWWMGSAVDRANLSKELRRYHDAGLGGMHIIPIYGAKGYESRYIEYLSPRWMEMLAHTVWRPSDSTWAST